MKKALLNFVLFFTVLVVSAQRGENYASSIGVSAGYVEDGLGFMATYNYHLNRKTYAQLNVFVAIAEDKGTFEIPYNIFTVQPGYFIKVWEQPSFKRYTLNIGGGGVIGYESINNGNNTLYTGAIIDAESQLIYGVFVGLEGEIILGNNFTILIKANEYYHANSDIGKFYPYAGIGLRYFLF
tara:strand:- start:371 stop:916 length:546 start_codon:yes stop_codon:yes gene_type:complete